MATYNNIKKIKIGDNVFNLYDSGNSGGTITSVKTAAGVHSAINVTSGAVSFNVPTKTSHLTNDSGFVNGIAGSSSVPVYVDSNKNIQAVDSIAIGLVERPFMRATGSTTNVSLTAGVITQIPLYTIECQSEYSGISLDTTKHTILLEPGYYRISGSVYFASGTAYSATQGIYIRMDSTDIAFANATEVAASYIYGAYSINTSAIVKVIDNCYLWLGARSSTAAAVDSDNTATYLTAEKIGSIY